MLSGLWVSTKTVFEDGRSWGWKSLTDESVLLVESYWKMCTWSWELALLLFWAELERAKSQALVAAWQIFEEISHSNNNNNRVKVKSTLGVCTLEYTW
jgi:hypothetical protein